MSNFESAMCEPSRKRVDPVEALYAFDAGLNLPISSGCQRRVGLKGVHVVQSDADKNQLSPTSVWARLD